MLLIWETNQNGNVISLIALKWEKKKTNQQQQQQTFYIFQCHSTTPLSLVLYDFKIFINAFYKLNDFKLSSVYIPKCMILLIKSKVKKNIFNGKGYGKGGKKCYKRLDYKKYNTKKKYLDILCTYRQVYVYRVLHLYIVSVIRVLGALTITCLDRLENQWRNVTLHFNCSFIIRMANLRCDSTVHQCCLRDVSPWLVSRY